MACGNDYVSIADLRSSERPYSLAEFVENFQLPRVVRVENGYYDGDDERTSLCSGQLVRLHSVQKRKKLVCKTIFHKTVFIPYACPLKCVVENGEFAKLSALQLSVLSENVQYIMAMTGYYNPKSPSNSFERGTVFEVNGLDSTRKCIQCSNTSTRKRIHIDYDCTAVFCWLRDCNRYTLAEVAVKFELPVKIRFVQKSSANKIDPDLPSVVLNLKEVNVVDITEETVVVLSVLGENSDDDRIEMAKDVPLSVLAREHGSGLDDSDIYQRMVDLTTRAKEAELKNKDLKCLENQQQTLKSISKATTPLTRSLDSTKPTQDWPNSSVNETTYLKMSDVTSKITVQRWHTELDHKRIDAKRSDKKNESVQNEPIDPKAIDLKQAKWIGENDNDDVLKKDNNRKPPQVKPKPFFRCRKKRTFKL